MSPKKFVLAIYPEAYLHKVTHKFGGDWNWCGIFARPENEIYNRGRLLGTASSPIGAWWNSVHEINDMMMEKLES
jgi:hypothetical protein